VTGDWELVDTNGRTVRFKDNEPNPAAHIVEVVSPLKAASEVSGKTCLSDELASFTNAITDRLFPTSPMICIRFVEIYE
jgi:hypothetical protein